MAKKLEPVTDKDITIITIPWCVIHCIEESSKGYEWIIVTFNTMGHYRAFVKILRECGIEFELLEPKATVHVPLKHISIVGLTKAMEL